MTLEHATSFLPPVIVGTVAAGVPDIGHTLIEIAADHPFVSAGLAIGSLANSLIRLRSIQASKGIKAKPLFAEIWGLVFPDQSEPDPVDPATETAGK